MKLLHLLWPCGIFRRGTFWFIEIIINFLQQVRKIPRHDSDKLRTLNIGVSHSLHLRDGIDVSDLPDCNDNVRDGRHASDLREQLSRGTIGSQIE